jgi:hypothetical protein
VLNRGISKLRVDDEIVGALIEHGEAYAIASDAVSTAYPWYSSASAKTPRTVASVVDHTDVHHRRAFRLRERRAEFRLRFTGRRRARFAAGFDSRDGGAGVRAPASVGDRSGNGWRRIGLAEPRRLRPGRDRRKERGPPDETVRVSVSARAIRGDRVARQERG